MRMLRATFQLVPGLGPIRERRLWRGAVLDWTQLSSAPSALLSPGLRGPLLAAVEDAERALHDGDLAAVASVLPGREHWRLYGAFAERAVYLDIETDLEEGITAIGLLDARGPRVLLAGRDREAFPALVPPDCLLVTFNGASFDLPVLERAFPDWQRPAAHVDLLPVLRRLGYHGGLKAIEEELGIGRPRHLRGLDGNAAVWLWRHGVRGNRDALRLFAEYNLYDAVNLRTLMAIAYNRLRADAGIEAPELPVSHRGDVLYDISKILLAL
jgi:uncharacterized protein YprB with RNaseH-like and TPR domain